MMSQGLKPRHGMMYSTTVVIGNILQPGSGTGGMTPKGDDCDDCTPLALRLSRMPPPPLQSSQSSDARLVVRVTQTEAGPAARRSLAARPFDTLVRQWPSPVPSQYGNDMTVKQRCLETCLEAGSGQRYKYSSRHRDPTCHVEFLLHFRFVSSLTIILARVVMMCFGLS